MVDSSPRSPGAAPDWHGRVLGSIEVDAPDGRTVEARLRVVDGLAASETDLLAVHDLLQRSFHGWPDFEIECTSLDHLLWKIGGPPGRPNSAVLWEIEGAIVGSNLDVYREVRVRGMDRRGRIGADSTVDPAWQGRGLNVHRRSIAQAFRAEQSAMMLGTTNHVRGVRHRPDNWVLHSPMRVLLAVRDPWRLAGAWRERGGRRAPRPAVAAALWGLGGLARLRGLASRRRVRRAAGASAVRLRAAERFDARVDELFEAAAPDFDLIVVRSHGYLNWRLCDERGGRFALLLAEAEGSDELLGYVVTRRDGDRGYIVDLLVRGGRLDVVDALLDRALGELRRDGAAGVVCWMVEDHPYVPALRRHGFFDSRRDPRLILRPVGMPAEELTFIREPGARVHLTHGDTDVI